MRTKKIKHKLLIPILKALLIIPFSIGVFLLYIQKIIKIIGLLFLFDIWGVRYVLSEFWEIECRW